MKRNKILSALLSLAIAFGIWMYVVTYVSSESTDTVYDIPISYEGETVLAERNLMITAKKTSGVNLTLKGNRSDLSKVNRSNITIKVDLTKVYDAGENELEYDIIYPGDVSSNAFNEESKYPGVVTIVVEKIGRKDVPVQVAYSGSAAENFLVDKENAVLDYSAISVTGPSSVVDLIDHARIDVDLEERNESISESYRYTLCDAEGNPVDVEQVTTNVAEVRLDLKIQRYKEIPVVLNISYGGGATEKTAKVEVKPSTIQVSGSEALLEELTEINLGSVDLATITENTQQMYPINLPEGVTNLTGQTEATVDISFSGLSIKEFTVESIQVTNIPEGMTYNLMSQVMKVTLRGPTALINSIEPENIVITVDLTDKELGATTVKATVTVTGEKYESVGAIGSYSVSVTLSEEEES